MRIIMTILALLIVALALVGASTIVLLLFNNFNDNELNDNNHGNN